MIRELTLSFRTSLNDAWNTPVSSAVSFFESDQFKNWHKNRDIELKFWEATNSRLDNIAKLLRVRA